MSGSFGREFGTALVEELALVAGALTDGAATVAAGAPLGGPQWVAEIAVTGTVDGSYVVALDAAGAAAFAARVTGLEGPAPPDTVIGTITEVCTQALGVLAVKPVARGATLTLAEVRSVEDVEPGAEWAAHAIAGDGWPSPLTVLSWGELRAMTDVAGAADASEPGDAVAEATAGGEALAGAEAGAAPQVPLAAALPPARPAPVAPASDVPPPERLDVILDIDLPLTVRFGRTELPLKALTRIAPGSLIDLGRSPDDPVEILVSNRVVARGEVVIVSGNYGIRIVDVVSQRDRVRSLEV